MVLLGVRSRRLDLLGLLLALVFDGDAGARAEPLEVALLLRVERLLVVEPAAVGGARRGFDLSVAPLVLLKLRVDHVVDHALGLAAAEIREVAVDA
jgi:hypothetical protein